MGGRRASTGRLDGLHIVLFPRDRHGLAQMKRPKGTKRGRFVKGDLSSELGAWGEDGRSEASAGTAAIELVVIRGARRQALTAMGGSRCRVEGAGPGGLAGSCRNAFSRPMGEETA